MSMTTSFEEYVESASAYNDKIISAGDSPWWLDPAKLAKLEAKIPGISQLPLEERRRALFEHHRGNGQ